MNQTTIFPSERLKAIFEKAAMDFCSRNQLTYSPCLTKGSLFVVAQEKCNLEYPGLNFGNHFYAKVDVNLQMIGERQFAVFKAHHDEKRNWCCQFDITKAECMLDLSTTIENEIKQYLFQVWESEERALDQYQKKPVKI